jgi:pyruvate-formate lyase-activating enzyme
MIQKIQKKNTAFHPRLLYAKESGEIFDAPGLEACGMSGGHLVLLNPQDWIPLPFGSDLFLLPHRTPIGWDSHQKKFIILDDFQAVCAFVAPAYTLRATVAYQLSQKSDPLPLNAYSPVGYYHGQYFVPALRVDPDIRQDLKYFNPNQMNQKAAQDRHQFPNNTFLTQMIKCAFEYHCPAARNYFHQRFEAPMPTSTGCNAQCVGCLSLQPDDLPHSPMNRLHQTPTPEEIADIIVPHLEQVPMAIASFGQGCEGEPLTQFSLLKKTLQLIRTRTPQGTLHLNTNASMPEKIESLAQSGLNSIRVSLNSVRKSIYNAYYRPLNYSFEDVIRSIQVAKKHNLFVSLNYFIFPGISDQADEIQALLHLIEITQVDFIQMRNLNIDPESYLNTVGKPDSPGLGIDTLFKTIHSQFPAIRFGYFNPPKEKWGKAGILLPA